MSLFFRDRAYKFFNHHAKSFINRVVNFRVNLYKIVVDETKTNIYGESMGKVYHHPVMVHCLIKHDDQVWSPEEHGTDFQQNATFYFQLEYLKDMNVVVEAGDIVEWNNNYWEIETAVENKLIHSLPEYNFAMVCEAHYTDITKLNLENIRSGVPTVKNII